jgi:hypothetical protein
MVWRIIINLLNIIAITTAGNVAGCSYTDPGNNEKRMPMPKRTIEQVQEEHTDEWMTIPGVVGTAIGLCEGKPCIRIFTSSKPQQLKDKIPSTIECYPIIIEETGAFRALD